MTFKESDESMAGGLFLQLEDDGDSVTVIFVGEPIPRESEFKGKSRKQFCFPVVSEAGLGVWTVGVKRYKQLRDSWKSATKAAVLITRKGKAGDTQTTYEFGPRAIPAALRKERAAIEESDIADMLEMLKGVSSKQPLPF